MGFSSIIMIVKIIYSVLVLGYFSWLDLKYRDIPDKLVWGSLAIAFILTGVDYNGLIEEFDKYSPIILLTSLIVSIIMVLLMIILYFMDYFGGADIVILSELLVLYPFYGLYEYSIFKHACIIHLPVLIVLLLYATLSLLLIFVARGLYVLIRYYDLLPRKLSFLHRIALSFIGRPVRIRDYLSMKHYYPLEVFEKTSGGGVKRRFRFSFSISEEYYEHQDRIRKLLEKGLVSADDYIWITYGIPFIVPVFIGFLLVLLLGDYPVVALFGSC